MLEEELTGRIIKVFYKVYNVLGHGFIESVYHNSMILELVDQGFSVGTEKPIGVYYGERIVGTFSADLLVNSKILIELKAKESIHPAHEASLQTILEQPKSSWVCCLTSARNLSSSASIFQTRRSDFLTGTTLMI